MFTIPAPSRLQHAHIGGGNREAHTVADWARHFVKQTASAVARVFRCEPHTVQKQTARKALQVPARLNRSSSPRWR